MCLGHSGEADGIPVGVFRRQSLLSARSGACWTVNDGSHSTMHF